MAIMDSFVTVNERRLVNSLLENKILVGEVVLAQLTEYEISPHLQGLRTDDGEVIKHFTAPSHKMPPRLSLDKGDHVSFLWINPGQRGQSPTNQLSNPVAHIIEKIDPETAQKRTAELKGQLGWELWTMLENKLAATEHFRTRQEKKLIDLQARERDLENFVHAEVSERVDHKVQQLQASTMALESEKRKVELEKKQLEDFFQKNILPYQAFLPSRLSAPAPAGAAIEPRELAQIWPHLLRRELNLPDDLALSFLVVSLAACLTGSLVLLSGPVGTGKTKTIRTAGRLLGGRGRVVPVRPGWLDSSDLLGFYDPLHRTYSPSPFVDYLIEAGETPHRPFFLALDELNLARIENYGADLLSVLEYSGIEPDGQDSSGLQLYAAEIHRRLLEERRTLKDKTELNTEEKLRRGELDQLLSTYPSTLPLPQNLVLLGTLNADETTYDLSPKVIDRSYVLAFPHAQLADQWEPQLPHEPYPLDLRHFGQWQKGTAKLPEPEQKQWDLISAWNAEYLKKVGLPLGYRAKRDYRAFMGVAKACGIKEDASLQYFIFTKILPRIGFLKDSDGTEEILTEFLAKIRSLGVCDSAAAVITWFETQLNDAQRPLVSFWR